jgi:hypothetical protein
MLAVGIALVPKCPACCLAYASLLSGLGIAGLPWVNWLMPAMFVLLAVNLVVVGVGALNRKSYGPLLLAVAGAVAIAIGKLWLDEIFLSWAGVAMVASASVWNFNRKPCSITLGRRALQLGAPARRVN